METTPLQTTCQPSLHYYNAYLRDSGSPLILDTYRSSLYTYSMNFRTLVLYIGLAILGFYLIGFILNLAAWALDIALIIGFALVVVALLNTRVGARSAAF